MIYSTIMTLKDTLSVFWRIGAGVVAMVYPPSRKKLHRIAHIAATVMTFASVVGVWLVSNVHWSARVGADLVLLVSYAAKWNVVISKVDTAIDKLPIPEEDAATILRLIKYNDDRGST
jgi:hypothetical protein